MELKQSFTRNSNTILVLSTIMNGHQVSRAKISELTGMNKATVSEIVRNLIEDQYVVEIGAGESSSAGGRKPIYLEINKKAGVSFSIDLRSDQISSLATYLNGEVIEKYTEHCNINKVNVIERLVNHVQEFNAKYKAKPFGIVGIAIAIHGVVNENKISYTPYFDIDEIDLVKELEDRLNIPVYIENEANLSALAEAAYDYEHTHLISFSVHTGIGAGIILDRQLLRGFKGRSGEIGHTILYPDGIQCACGNKGCFEQYASLTALIRRFQNLKKDDQCTFDDLIKAVEQKDADTIVLIDHFAKDLSIGLMNIMGTYDPEVIYVNSEIFDKLPNILSIIDNHLDRSIYKNIQLFKSKLGSQASLYGATVLNLKNFFNLDEVKFDTGFASKAAGFYDK
ncbi:ROK family transcriptional regulator [Marinilactibacillus sp. Marseille-P9653]|uniref:ROK family transcriptional regulator n=1 Tax=Marinilactibacillus sp. Marseille-P9653 TaxID=2866583 RepID=UPI001CE3FDB1|nr:ROK family transcriptional regulator [Marinilactibacillus sp. Marseille-P9653]